MPNIVLAQMKTTSIASTVLTGMRMSSFVSKTASSSPSEPMTCMDGQIFVGVSIAYMSDTAQVKTLCLSNVSGRSV